MSVPLAVPSLRNHWVASTITMALPRWTTGSAATKPYARTHARTHARALARWGVLKRTPVQEYAWMETCASAKPMVT